MYARQEAGTTVGGGGSSTTHKHSYSYKTTSATCTTEGKRVGTCSCGATTTETIPKKAHVSDGKWHQNSTSHWNSCTTCGAQLNFGGHSGTWYDGGDGKHYKNCSTCGKSKYTSANHNKGSTKKYENDDKHHMKCSDCTYVWPSSHDEKHNWAHAEGDHTCSNCGYVLSGIHHYYDVAGDAKELYTCKYNEKGNPCSYTISIDGTSISAGLSAMWYCASDAIEKMKPVPAFPKGVHTFNYSGTLYDSPTGGPYTNLKAPDSWFKLLGWGQKSVYTHAMPNINRIYENAQDENGDYTISRAEATSSVLNSSYVRLMQTGPAGYWDQADYNGALNVARARNGRIYADL